MSKLRVIIFISTLLFSVLTCAADTTEYEIKAAYLYKFADYVEWPPTVAPQSDEPFTIGVLNAKDMEEALRDLTAKNSIQGRKVVIKHLNQNLSLTGIQMLFIGNEESQSLKSLLEPMQSQPVLTVTESTDALSAGSIINFIPVDERIRFEVSVTHAERNGLKISARLLSVAQHIESGGP